MANGGGHFLICSCYYTHNIFLKDYKLHVTYLDDRQFSREYKTVLKQRGCITEQNYEIVLSRVKEEVERRKNNGKQHVLRTQLITEKYERLHPNVYSLSESYLDPKFLEVVSYCSGPGASGTGLLDLITEEEAPNVFSCPVFTLSFCGLLLEELEHFECSELPKGRPNTMNKGGVLLSELGFDEGFMNTFRLNYLMPIARLLYPDWVREGLDSHRAFVVKYKVGEDVDLSYHFDNAEVTLNVCLGKRFEGGDLYFGKMKEDQSSVQNLTTYQHRVGQGLLHRGQHMHGAHPITSGERYNLIVWTRSSCVRNSLCPMCNRTPHLLSNQGYGDGFTTSGQHQYEMCSTV